MICRLYELFNDTGIDIGKKENCDLECPEHSHNINDKCKICKNTEIKLTKQKYSWLLSRKILFDNVQFLKDEDTVHRIIKLIHPSHSNIWIIKWVSLDNNNNHIIIFTLHIAHKEYEFKNLEDVNLFLKYKCEYEGRPITINDFEI